MKDCSLHNVWSVSAPVWNNLLSFEMILLNNVKGVYAELFEVKSPSSVHVLQVLCSKIA